MRARLRTTDRGMARPLSRQAMWSVSTAMPSFSRRSCICPDRAWSHHGRANLLKPFRVASHQSGGNCHKPTPHLPICFDKPPLAENLYVGVEPSPRKWTRVSHQVVTSLPVVFTHSVAENMSRSIRVVQSSEVDVLLRTVRFRAGSHDEP